jgi:hypothetical protein
MFRNFGRQYSAEPVVNSSNTLVDPLVPEQKYEPSSD